MRRIPEEEARMVRWDKASLDVKNCIMESQGTENPIRMMARKLLKRKSKY